jgi:hypothetical protein
MEKWLNHQLASGLPYYFLMLLVMFVGFSCLFAPKLIFMLPVVYYLPWTLFRWTGKHEPQWLAIYPIARRNRAIFYASSDPREPEPPWPKKVLFDRPRFSA